MNTATDERIQPLIRESFKGHTLLCIAHRLNTVVSALVTHLGSDQPSVTATDVRSFLRETVLTNANAVDHDGQDPGAG